MSEHADSVCEFLSWDSDFFGCRVGRVRGDVLNEALAASVDSWASSNSVRALYFLARSDDPMTTRTAEDRGYNLVDVRMTFEQTLALAEQDEMQRPSSGSSIRSARSEDLAALQRIAAAAHNGTRFANDPHFDAERVRALYATWIKLDCEGRAQQVLVGAGDNDEAVGYISCHLGADGAGQIGLVGVSSQFRGNGLGSALVSGALKWFRDQKAYRVTVVTQGSNKAAQRLYQKCGFLTLAVQLWYHKWFR